MPKLTARQAVARSICGEMGYVEWEANDPELRRYCLDAATLQLRDLRSLGFSVVPTPRQKLSKKRSA